MKLSELKHRVWKDERIKDLRLRKDEIKLIIDVVLEYILKGLLEDKLIKLKGLFTLDVRKAKGRKISNPQTGEHMHSEDYYKVGITYSKVLKDGLENLRDKNKS